MKELPRCHEAHLLVLLKLYTLELHARILTTR
jgi:hypothetical protein